MEDAELIALARAKAARWQIEDDGTTGYCIFTWQRYLDVARTIEKLAKKTPPSIKEVIKHTLKSREAAKAPNIFNGLRLADVVFSAHRETSLNDEPFVADRFSLAAALQALAFNADWEAEDPKFMVLRIAEQIKSGEAAQR
jgi:hypothetical protein